MKITYAKVFFISEGASQQNRSLIKRREDYEDEEKNRYDVGSSNDGVFFGRMWGGGETKEPKVSTTDQTAASQQGTAKPDKVYEIKLTSNDSTNTIWLKKMQVACDKISEWTGGGVSIQIHGNGEMLVADEGLEAVMSDAAVFYFADPNNYGDYVPELNTICAPYLWDDYKNRGSIYKDRYDGRHF